MQGPIDEDERSESIRRQIAIREEIKALMQQQKEEEKERNKIIHEQIHELIEKQKQESQERQRALQEQIDAIVKRQKEEDGERKMSLKDQIVSRMDMARDEHVRMHHSNSHRDQQGNLQDMGDVEIRKGFLKFHILSVLKHGPTHGYDIMHRISQHTGHLWRPSPGSLYPALESLEAKGFITCQGDGRRKIYSLTPKGEDAIEQVRKKRQEQFLEMKAFLSNILGE